jgi:DNA-binding beta-propeller fold protein YncE
MLKTSVTCRSALLALFVLQLSASVASGEPNEILKPAGAIALGRLEGHVSSMAQDADGGRLYVAETVYPPVIVAVDAKSGKEIGRTSKGLGHPEGVAFVPDSDHLVVSNAGGRISLYDGNLTLAGVVENEGRAGCVRYDPVSKLAYVGHGSARNWIAVVDPRKLEKVDDIKLDGFPVGFQLETKGNRMFVNIPLVQQIAVIDRQKRAVVGIWPLQDPRWSFPQNFAMALDEEHHRLFVGCWRPAKLVVIDTDTGKIVSTIDCCPDVGDMYYDTQRKRIYASGNEYVSVFKQADPNTYKTVGFVTTGTGAVRSLFVPATRKFYVAVPDLKALTAKLLVFDCGTDDAPTTAPAAAAAN